MRGLSEKFIHCLKSENCLLRPVLERVKKDDTLMLAIRDGYINIYYRGGNLLKISEKSNFYEFFFDKKYDLSLGHKAYDELNLCERIAESAQIEEFAQIEKWVASIARLKELMDFWFNEHPKTEREFQQLVERENNRSSISNETEYFIIDIEMADLEIGARFDLLAIKWLASGRQDGRNCKATFIEMKYGDDALDGKSGLLKHLEGISAFLEKKEKYSAILKAMTGQFNQLVELGLIKFNQSKFNNTKVELNPTNKPEFIFLLANHNPRSKKLQNILLSDEFKKYVESDLFDLRFFVSSDAGYGMHNYNMLTYKNYVNLRRNLQENC